MENNKDKVVNSSLYGVFKNNTFITNDAHSFEVFAIKDSQDSPSGKQAFIGFKIDNGDFHFIAVPYTEPIKYMNEEQIRDFAIKAADSSQFMSNHPYDHKSYEDGFYKGMEQALHQLGNDMFLLPDIRNKLSPIKNLIAMLENGLVKGDIEMHDLVLKEIESCKESLSYLSNNTTQ